MIDLSTQYLGLNLRTPLVASASPFPMNWMAFAAWKMQVHLP